MAAANYGPRRRIANEAADEGVTGAVSASEQLRRRYCSSRRSGMSEHLEDTLPDAPEA